MNPGAGVRSLEALKDWYSALTQFRGDAQNALISLSMALQHARDWLEEQQDFWRRAIRKAEEDVTHAKQELRTRKQQKFLGEQPDTTVQEKELRRAQAVLEYAEERLEAVRRWIQKLPRLIQDTYEGPSRNLEFLLDADLPRALALLDRQLGSLEQYLALKPEVRPAATPATPATEATPKKEPT